MRLLAWQNNENVSMGEKLAVMQLATWPLLTVKVRSRSVDSCAWW